MNQLQSFGRRLRAVRKAAKLTQEETAEKAYLNPKYLGQIERGEKRPSFDAVISLARALQVSPSVFFEFDQEWFCQLGLAPFDHLIWPHLSY